MFKRSLFAVSFTAVLLASSLATAQSGDDAPRSRTFQGTDVTTQELIRSLVPVGVDAGTEVSVIAPVKFAFDSAALTGESRAILDRMAAAFSSPELSGARFLIEGHTDATGRDGYNQNLSERRASSVYAYLADRVSTPERISARGFGEQRPLPDMSPYDGRNRRVEFVRLP